MSDKNASVVTPYMRADISYENEKFETTAVTYGPKGRILSIEGEIDNGRRTLSLNSFSKFSPITTYTLVPGDPKDGEARLQFYRPRNGGGGFTAYSSSGTLQFVVEPDGTLRGFFDAFCEGSPTNFPDMTIKGTFHVKDIPQ